MTPKELTASRPIRRASRRRTAVAGAMADGRYRQATAHVPEGASEADDEPMNYETPLSDVGMVDEKWPAWKVTVFVLAFCGSFWTGVVYLLARLLG